MIKIERVETWGWEAAIRGMRNPLNSWEKSDSRFCDDVAWAKEDTARTPAACAAHTHDINDECYTEAGDVFDPLVVTDFSIGENDEKLMKTLIRGGPVECKFRRMIHVQMDITAPLYWWKEFDTYKVGTVANSCSTMHKIHAKEFTMEDFSTEHLFDVGDLIDPKYRFSPEEDVALSAINVQGDRCYFTPSGFIKMTCDILNRYREKYLAALKTEEKTGFSAKDIWWQMIQLLPSSYNQKRTVDISYEVLANIYRHRKGHKLDEWREFCFNMSEILPYSWIFTEEFEGGAGWKEKDPDYKDILLKISDLVKEGKIKQEDILDAVGFSFGVNLNKETKPSPFTREGEQQMLEEIRREVAKENSSKN